MCVIAIAAVCLRSYGSDTCGDRGYGGKLRHRSRPTVRRGDRGSSVPWSRIEVRRSQDRIRQACHLIEDRGADESRIEVNYMIWGSTVRRCEDRDAVAFYVHNGVATCDFVELNSCTCADLLRPSPYRIFLQCFYALLFHRHPPDGTSLNAGKLTRHRRSSQASSWVMWA